MQIKTRGIGIEKYIEEGLLAPLPLYREGAGRSIVFTLEGRHRDPRVVPW